MLTAAAASRLPTSQADGAFCKIQRLHKQTHAHCCGVPATRYQPLENCALGGFAAEMKHLWIKLVSEFNHLLLRYV